MKILDLKAVLGLGRRFGPRVESDRSGDVSLVRVDLICFYESGWLSPAGDVRAPDGTGAYTKNHRRESAVAPSHQIQSLDPVARALIRLPRLTPALPPHACSMSY